MATADGKKTGGRKKGTKNKSTEDMQNQIDEAMKDHKYSNPIIAMVHLGMQAEESADLDMALKCYKEVAPYYSPKLKSMELTGKDGEPVQTKVTFVGVSAE